MARTFRSSRRHRTATLSTRRRHWMAAVSLMFAQRAHECFKIITFCSFAAWKYYCLTHKPQPNGNNEPKNKIETSPSGKKKNISTHTSLHRFFLLHCVKFLQIELQRHSKLPVCEMTDGETREAEGSRPIWFVNFDEEFFLLRVCCCSFFGRRGVRSDLRHVVLMRS